MSDITIQDAEAQRYYQLPKILFSRKVKLYEEGLYAGKMVETSFYAKEERENTRDKRYDKNKVAYFRKAKLSKDAKIAYAVLYDRALLSLQTFRESTDPKKKFKYVDEQGSIFANYTIEDLQDLLDIGSKTTINKLKGELHAFGLLREQEMGMNKPNRLYVQNIDVTAQKTEVYNLKNELIRVLDAQGTIIYEKREKLEKEPETLDVTGSPNFGRPNIELSGVQILNGTEPYSSEPNNNDTNRYENSKEFSDLGNYFENGITHHFLTDKTVKLLSRIGQHAKDYQDIIFRTKKQMEKKYQIELLRKFPLDETPSLSGELFAQELEVEVEKLIFKVKEGERAGEKIVNPQAYFTKQLQNFWLAALTLTVITADVYQAVDSMDSEWGAGQGLKRYFGRFIPEAFEARMREEENFNATELDFSLLTGETWK